MFNVYGKYTSATIYADVCERDALSQIYDLCNHPKFYGALIRIMPDVHAGAGVTVGTTVKMSSETVFPSIVGADIGCGVLTVVFATEKELDFKALDDFIYSHIPFGMSIREAKHPMLQKGLKVQVGELCERLSMQKSEQAFLRSCGTLGGGNHYIEIGRMKNGKYALTIHTGSRAFGKCIAECHANNAKNYLHTNNITGVNKALPFLVGDAAKSYLRDMLAAVNFAKENRRLIARDILDFLHIVPEYSFDTIHNYIEVEGDGCITLRKGAISAKKDEIVAIPMNMRDGVLICRGLGNPDWNYSAPHGAGRLMSRSEAKATLSLEDYAANMHGIASWSVLSSTIDESPMAYKPMDSILSIIGETVEVLDIIKPLYNFKARSVSGK